MILKKETPYGFSFQQNYNGEKTNYPYKIGVITQYFDTHNELTLVFNDTTALNTSLTPLTNRKTYSNYCDKDSWFYIQFHLNLHAIGIEKRYFYGFNTNYFDTSFLDVLKNQLSVFENTDFKIKFIKMIATKTSVIQLRETDVLPTFHIYSR